MRLHNISKTVGFRARWFQKHKLTSMATQTDPSLPFVPNSPPLDSVQLEKLQQFIHSSQQLFVITGAGISTESGIPDYRSEGVGFFAKTDQRPVQHREFVQSASARQRYWARNFLGWSHFFSHEPNAAHWALNYWEKLGKLHWLVTQNVDALHTKAGNQCLTELHGCTHRVICLGCGLRIARSQLQDIFIALNPMWTAEVQSVAPDGDVFITEEQVINFRIPGCATCGGILKPDVTFFGDSVSPAIVTDVYQHLSESDAVLVVGSSLQVYSGYKFILTAYEKKLPIAILNIGPTRADHLASIKVASRCGKVLPEILTLRET